MMLFKLYKLIRLSDNREKKQKKIIFMTEFWYWEDTSFVRKLLNKFTKVMLKDSDSIFAMNKCI
ncbi:hypothetical protein DU37_05625 [Methanosarcina mazei]|uniref:Uncharacterized protein n=1 Tax=Methanosarcina mazei TaxID=2209 RepID=A0A0F8PAZ9_METMZ|nr:hypothetical protein DU37_05625 [Methanosarcina mazei]